MERMRIHGIWLTDPTNRPSFLVRQSWIIYILIGLAGASGITLFGNYVGGIAFCLFLIAFFGTAYLKFRSNCVLYVSDEGFVLESRGQDEIYEWSNIEELRFEVKEEKAYTIAVWVVIKAGGKQKELVIRSWFASQVRGRFVELLLLISLSKHPGLPIRDYFDQYAEYVLNVSERE